MRSDEEIQEQIKVAEETIKTLNKHKGLNWVATTEREQRIIELLKNALTLGEKFEICEDHYLEAMDNAEYDSPEYNVYCWLIEDCDELC